jgi:glycosyltransferase involved in cell wall biosynthesis
MSRRLKIGCWFNSPYLGGAERSFVHQINYLSKAANIKLTSFVPVLGTDSRDLMKEIESHSLVLKKIEYPKGLFSISRTKKIGFSSFLKLPYYFLKTLGIAKTVDMKSYDCHWSNGNKIGLVLFFLCIILRYKGTMIWHLRDYPAENGFFRFIWSLLARKYSFNVIVVANSKSVLKKAQVLVKGSNCKFQCLYNFMGENLTVHQFSKSQITLGAASMYAPWKGLHEIVIAAAMYEDELLDLGVKKISLFGEMLYETDGEHGDYYKELVLLKNKLGGNLVKFEGKKKPIQIFREIDILIHSSILPEPFGRVILEAMKSKIPVISTGLGGSAEIVKHLETGLIYQKSDYAGLFLCIKQYIENDIFRNTIIENGLQKYEELNRQAESQISMIFEFLGAKIEIKKTDDKIAA